MRLNKNLVVAGRKGNGTGEVGKKLGLGHKEILPCDQKNEASWHYYYSRSMKRICTQNCIFKTLQTETN